MKGGNEVISGDEWPGIVIIVDGSGVELSAKAVSFRSAVIADNWKKRLVSMIANTDEDEFKI